MDFERVETEKLPINGGVIGVGGARGVRGVRGVRVSAEVSAVPEVLGSLLSCGSGSARVSPLLGPIQQRAESRV